MHIFTANNAPISYTDISEAFVRPLDGKSGEDMATLRPTGAVYN